MISSAPPSYLEAVDGKPEACGAGGQPNFCTQCGHASSGGAYCGNCGLLLVQTTQPVGYGGPQMPASPPIIQPQQPVEVFPPSLTVDIEHKHDMAYKDGNRLIYDFEKVGCCPWDRPGLQPQVKDQLPWELEQKGITAHQWREWMMALMENQKRAPSVVGCLCIFCFPAGLVQSILCACLCPISMDQPLKCLPCFYGDWYVGLRQWQDNVNAVLNRHGMHVKLMTYKPHNRAPKSKMHANRVTGKDEKYEMSFMVISLTPEETEKLKYESWDHGVNDTCTSGIGRCL